MPFGPEEPLWIYTGSFHTEMQGGAFRLPNGNTLITDCDDGYIFEVTQDNYIVWDFIYNDGENIIARAQKYSMDYLNIDPDSFTIGDVNYDGYNNLIDILMIADMTIGYGYAPNPPADYNSDGMVDMDDFTSLLEFIINN